MGPQVPEWYVDKWFRPSLIKRKEGYLILQWFNSSIYQDSSLLVLRSCVTLQCFQILTVDQIYPKSASNDYTLF